MKRLMTILLFVSFSLAITVAAQAAQKTISVSCLANETKLGYIKDSSYTFFWTVNGSYEGDSTDGFYNYPTAGVNRWCAEDSDAPELIINAGGDGLSGRYIRPITDFYSPNEFLENSNYLGKTWLTIGVRDDSYKSVGLEANGVAISYLAFCTNGAGVDFGYSGLFTSPGSYLETYLGDYIYTTLDSYSYVRISSGAEGIFLEFTVTPGSSYSIKSNTIHPVPEPAGMTILATGLLGIIFRRRKA